MKGVRQDGAAPTAAPERKEVTVPLTTLSRYIGVYQLAPNFSITITLKDDHLIAQATGQPSARIFASSPTRFFYRVVDAEIEFFSDSTGKVDRLVLYQDGHEVRGVKH